MLAKQNMMFHMEHLANTTANYNDCRKK